MSEAIWSENCNRYPILEQAGRIEGLPEYAYACLVNCRRRMAKPYQITTLSRCVKNASKSPDGESTIAGEVVASKVVRFPNGGSQMGFLVQCQGYRVFGPLPRGSATIGEAIKFRARFSRKSDDFSTFRRAELLSGQENSA